MVPVDVFLLRRMGIELFDQVACLVVVHADDPGAMPADIECLAAVGHGLDQPVLGRRERDDAAHLRRDLALEARAAAAFPEIVDAGEAFDPVLHRLRQIVIGGAGVDEPGIAARFVRRGFDPVQQRPFGRHRVERTVGVEPLRTLAELPGFGAVGNDLAIVIEIAGIEDHRIEVPRALGPLGRVLGAARDFERAEGAAEDFLLLVRNLGVADREHAVARHRILDRCDQLGIRARRSNPRRPVRRRRAGAGARLPSSSSAPGLDRLARQLRNAHQRFVHRPRALPAFADRPDDQALPPAHVAAGEHHVFAGLVVVRIRVDIAAVGRA